MKTLRECLPKEALSDEPKLEKFYDIKVVKEHSTIYETEEFPYTQWPGTHKHVGTWWELENGYVVGWNENPSWGWSFPVVKIK